MTASGAHGPSSTSSVGSLQALSEIKRAEEEVRKMKAAADKRAEEIVREARDEAGNIVDEARKNAQLQAESTIQKAVKLAESEAEGILQGAEQSAAKLRNVSDAKLDKAASEVLDAFKDRVGGA